MLVIHRRGSCCRGGGIGRYYHGSGIVDDIGRTLLSKAISSGTSSAIAHKVVDSVVNGATLVGKKTANAALKGAVNAVVQEKLAGRRRRKRPSSSTTAIADPPLAKRFNIDSLIDGSGIVYD